MTDWARAVRLARVSAGLSSAELAARACLHGPNLSHIEAGRRQPTSVQLECIANATGLSVEALRVLGTKSLRELVTTPAPPAPR